MPNVLGRFILQALCRVLHGHIMIRFASDKGKDEHGRGWYMCARCLRCEIIHDVPEEAQ